MKEELLQNLSKSIIAGFKERVEENVDKLVKEGISVDEILGSMTAAMEEVGAKYETREYFLPELVLAGQSMRAALSIILPKLKQEGKKFLGKILIGSVEGDVHDLGKSIVESFLVGARYNVTDLGINVPVDVFVNKARELEVDVVGASAYMTTTTLQLPKINEALKEAGIRDQVKYIIGGASTSEGYVSWAGADGWAENAADAVLLVNNLLAYTN